jgi:hypothetical protein
MIEQFKTRMDGWRNLFSGIGKKGADKTEDNSFSKYSLFDDQTLSYIYDGDGLGTRIINRIPDDMTRTGWEIDNDKDGKIKEEQDRLKLGQILNQALKYARLYRGCIVVIITETGSLEIPLSSAIQKIVGLKVFSAARIQLFSSDFISDPNSPFFEDVEWFHVLLRDGSEQIIHRSRCIVFKGEMTSDYGDLDLQYKYWGFSIIQKIWNQLSNYGVSEKGVANLMQEFAIGKYTLANLAQILARNTPEAYEQIYNRIESIHYSKSIINAVLLDEKENYTRDSVNVTGLPELIDRAMMNLSAVCGIPVTLLFGRSPAGMNATGESDIRDYYDGVDVKRNNILLPEIQKITNIIGGYVYPSTTEKYTITFNSLWEPTRKEQAEIDNLEANTYEKWIVNMVLDPEEVRAKIFPELEQSTINRMEEEPEESILTEPLETMEEVI